MRKTEWNSKFESNSRDGREVSIGKKFYWNGCTFHVPAVYLCDEGLIVDLCIQADREQYRAFLDRWRELFEREKAKGKISPREYVRFESENPLDRMFETAVKVNGKTLRYKGGNGMQWIPNELLPIMRDEINIKPFMVHYGLSEDQVWQFRRDLFFWEDTGVPEMESLELTLSQRPKMYPSTEFPTPGAGEQISIVNPLNGTNHILTVTEIHPEQIKRFQQEDLLFPEHCLVMSYTLEPELPKDVFFLTDTEEPDQPKRIGSKSVIGAAIGVIVSNKEKPEGHYAASSLRFEPVENVIWQAQFRAKTVQDLNIPLI